MTWIRLPFEACAVAILERDWPRLVSVRGGSDDGFDAAVADGGRQEPFPVVITTARGSDREPASQPAAGPAQVAARGPGSPCDLASHHASLAEQAVWGDPTGRSDAGPDLRPGLVRAEAVSRANLVQASSWGHWEIASVEPLSRHTPARARRPGPGPRARDALASRSGQSFQGLSGGRCARLRQDVPATRARAPGQRIVPGRHGSDADCERPSRASTTCGDCR